jgi:hypothetical protein
MAIVEILLIGGSEDAFMTPDGSPGNNTFAPSQGDIYVIEARLPGPVIAQVRLILLTIRLGA